MSGDPLCLPTPDGAWEISVDTRAVASCADRRTAMRLRRLIRGNHTDLLVRPRALPEVQCFETAEGRVEVVVGVRTIARCADWRWATRVARLIEVDEYQRLTPFQRADVSPRQRMFGMFAQGGGCVR